MPSLRQDSLTHQWVIIADRTPLQHRRLAPKVPEIQRGWLCPFCPGNESKTPEEVYAVRPEGSEPNSSGWSLRVVPSNNPSLSFDEPKGGDTDSLFRSIPPHGAQEVVIETEIHDFPLIRYEQEKLAEILTAFQSRVNTIYGDKRIGYVQIHRNEGALAGANFEHPHAAILGLPIVPDGIRRQLEIGHEHFAKHNRCLTCEIVERELKAGDRIVDSSEHFVCIAPFASRVPYELRIIPTAHAQLFGELDEERVRSLAGLLKRCFWALHETLDSPALNYVVRTSPRGVKDFKKPLAKFDHWRLEILPQTHAQPGLTWGTGLYSNPVPPEKVARDLRELLAKQPEAPHPLTKS